MAVAVFGVMVGTDPDQAMNNLAKWYEMLANVSAPPWLRDQDWLTQELGWAIATVGLLGLTLTVLAARKRLPVTHGAAAAPSMAPAQAVDPELKRVLVAQDWEKQLNEALNEQTDHLLMSSGHSMAKYQSRMLALLEQSGEDIATVRGEIDARHAKIMGDVKYYLPNNPEVIDGQTYNWRDGDHKREWYKKRATVAVIKDALLHGIARQKFIVKEIREAL